MTDAIAENDDEVTIALTLLDKEDVPLRHSFEQEPLYRVVVYCRCNIF